MYKLIIEDDEGKTTVVPLIRDEISIGRKEGNTIRLTERNVSRRHARLVRQNGAVYIEDLQSHNGIKVNGDRINSRAAVGEGDRIQIGDYQLSVKLERTESRPQKPSAQVPEDPPTTPFVKSTEATAQVASPAMSSSATVPVTMPPMAVPTVPIAALSAAQSPQKERPARLVVVSRHFFRQEFLIDKAAVVIGRTDENDVVINHRSISRHHAKIVREGGHYHISDLQSANGVRVNGEEYGKVELRKGDMIDLGHVRLVFISPGADVEISNKPYDPEGATGGRRTGLVLGLAFLVIIGGAVAAVRYSGYFAGGGKGGDADGEAAKLLVDVEGDVRARRWDDALGKADRVLAIAGTSPKVREAATEKRERAESEKKAQEVFDRFGKFVVGKQYDEAFKIYASIPASSVYQKEGKDVIDKFFPDFAAQHVRKAEEYRNASRCDDFHAEVKKVLDIEPTHFEAKAAGDKPCPPEVQAPQREKHPQPGGRRTPAVGATEPKATPPGDTETPEDPGNINVDDQLKEAQAVYVNGDFAKAIELARPVRNATGASSRAWRIIGAAACNLKDLKLVGDAYRKLDPTGRQFLVYVCQRTGNVMFDKDKGQFKLVE